MLENVIQDLGNFAFLKIFPRWVAGSSAAEAISYCKELNGKGSKCIINYLGEKHARAAPIADALKEYMQLVDLIYKSKLKASITLKPSQLGFNLLEERDARKFCEKQMNTILEYANSKRVFVWIDMEDSKLTDFTLAFYKKNISKYKMGVTIQANLKRTNDDLDSFIRLAEKNNVFVRLVKGIYNENEEIALTDPHEVHLMFMSLVTKAFEQGPKNLGIAIASHHTQVIELAVKLQEENKKKFFEIQVLKGVMPEYYQELRENGINVAEYMPYGPKPFAYSVRRAKRNANYSRSILFKPFFYAYRKLYS